MRFGLKNYTFIQPSQLVQIIECELPEVPLRKSEQGDFLVGRQPLQIYGTRAGFRKH
jgi:hypothetical protein